ncbi:MAG: hypothetical protein LBD59_05270 [Prevotellaceae bacterium]|nr:hypothetical protein [Prevotellaceae bacterium]
MRATPLHCDKQHAANNHKNQSNHPKITVQTKALKGRHQQHRATPCDMYAVVERIVGAGRALPLRRIAPFQGSMYAWTDIHRALPCAIDARALPLCAGAISRPANNHKNQSNHPKITVQTKVRRDCTLNQPPSHSVPDGTVLACIRVFGQTLFISHP